MKNPDKTSNSFNSLPAESAFDLSGASRYMNIALQEAIAGAEEDEVPVGAVIEYQGKIIGRAHNQRELLSDPTAHAEMIALTQAAAYLETWRLNGCTIYVTLEPCPMCAGALVLSRLDRLVYGPADPKAGACESLYNIVQDERLNHRIKVISGFMASLAARYCRSFSHANAVKQKTTPKNNYYRLKGWGGSHRVFEVDGSTVGCHLSVFQRGAFV